MIRLFSPEAFRDYLNNPEPDSYSGNGSIILSPTECVSQAEIDGVWQLTMNHPYDIYSKYSYIQKNSVIVVDAKLAREQQSTKQAFRIMEVRPKDNQIEIMAYPVAWESIYEVPLSAVYEEKTANELIDIFNSLYSNKFYLDKQFTDTRKVSVYIEDSNLQEMLNGEQEGTFKTVFGTELVYDNYNYRILPYQGTGNTESDAKKYKVLDAVNITGVDISESTVDMVTRIIPLSNEGYQIRNKNYIDAEGYIEDNPFVYAKIITYNDIHLVDEKAADDYTPETDTQYATRQAKAMIVAAVRELSEKYLRMARRGEWAHNYDYNEIDHENPHDHVTAYSRGKDRASLPYGYLFYSYTDAIGVLTQKVLDGLITDDNEYELFADAIKEGFKWCETTEIAGWDWRYATTYGDAAYNQFYNYHWIQDDFGWYYGDGAGNYIQAAWVEDAIDRHYWIGDDGYWDSTYDDYEVWDWHEVDQGWWYGTPDENGMPKNFAREQYMYTSRSGNWYWFNTNGIWDDGSEKTWRYGTEDDSDGVKFGYHQVGNHIWWFNVNGTIDPNLYYIDSYRWTTDEHGYYFGDSNGHWMANCWIEDSSEKHYWVDEDGYWDPQYDDTHKWAWQGDNTSGWWYGFEGDDEHTESHEETHTIPDNFFRAFKGIKNYLGTRALTDSVDTIAATTLDYLRNLSYDTDSTAGHLDTICHNTTSYTKSEFLNSLNYELDSTSYDYTKDDDAYDETESETVEETTYTHVLVYARNQYMYVSDSKTWYWFDADGYLVAAWCVDDGVWDWKVDGVGWWYGDGNGSYPDGQWMKINSKWYFFNTDGYADTTTDDYEVPKAGSTDSATYDSNREGVGSTTTHSSSDEATYDADREGVRAWIQDGFVEELTAVVAQADDDLKTTMERLLNNAANIDLSVMCKPSLSITINFAMLANSQNYEKYAFLKDLYLGDHVYVYSKKYNMEAIERVTSVKYDCIKQEITEMTFETKSYKKKGFIPGLAKQLTTSGTIIKYNPQDAIETGYGDYLSTGYGVDLTTL